VIRLLYRSKNKIFFVERATHCLITIFLSRSEFGSVSRISWKIICRTRTIPLPLSAR